MNSKLSATLFSCLLATGLASAAEAPWGDGDRWQKWEHSDRWSADPESHPNADRRAEKWAAYQDRLQANLELMDGKPGRRRGQATTDSGGNEGVCDGLAGATAGLERLCVAFCEAQDCRPDFSLDNPYEGCSAGAVKVLDSYERKRGPDDPEMPCLAAVDPQPDPEPLPEPDTLPDDPPGTGACPCWSDAELAGLRGPSGTDTLGICFQNASSEPVFSNYDTWHLSSADYETTVSTIGVSQADGDASVCSLVDTCADGSCLGISRYMPVNATQFAACEAELAASAASRGMTCQDLGQ